VVCLFCFGTKFFLQTMNFFSSVEMLKDKKIDWLDMLKFFVMCR
jgi:hypothetical protein